MRRALWGLGLGGLLLVETLAFLLFVLVALYFGASSREPGMLGITLLDVVFWGGVIVALEMGLVGIIAGTIIAGFAPRQFAQQGKRAAFWQRTLKSGAVWGLIGFLSLPLWMAAMIFVSPMNVIWSPFFCPVGTLTGLMINFWFMMSGERHENAAFKDIEET